MKIREAKLDESASSLKSKDKSFKQCSSLPLLGIQDAHPRGELKEALSGKEPFLGV